MSLFFAAQGWAQWCKIRYKVHWAEYGDTVLCVYQIPISWRKLPKRNRNSISLFLDLVSLALAYLHYLSYSSPLLRLTSS
ncbi:hypothetical protein N7449_006845 [Penicillium cf. viridicatum]|uniref:Uncharacterized protein n=1 Tax=Penicillium cf. viridicatum TaxID=2972119 RepID=A0A9W9JL95_9EURO|nr:hypothetical protein N7449_006845 [Penicillium cf. viridicatum]